MASAAHNLPLKLYVPLTLEADARLRTNLDVTNLTTLFKILLTYLQDYIHKSEAYAFVSIIDVVENNGKILFVFEIKTLEELDELYNCIKSPCNQLSQCITTFFVGRSLDLMAGYPSGTKVECKLWMEDSVFYEYRSAIFGESRKLVSSNEHGQAQGHPLSAKEAEHAVNVQKRVKEIEESACCVPGRMQGSEANVWEEGREQNRETARTEKQSDSSKEVPLLQKTFLLYYPIPQGWKIASMRIESDQCKYLNGKMEMYTDDMFKFKIAMPANQYEKCQYRYHAISKKDRLLLKGKSDEKSNNLRVQDQEIQRDIWDDSGKKSYAVKGILAHTEDIIFHTPMDLTVNESCIQLENVCSRHHLGKENAIDVVRSLQKRLQEYESNETNRILFVVAIGNIMRTPETLYQSKCIDREVAIDTMTAFQRLNLADFSPSCQSSIKEVCSMLCRVICGKEMSVLSNMNLRYPFFGDLWLVQNTEKKKEMFAAVEDNETMCSQGLQLCSKVYSSISKYQSADAERALCLLFSHLPLKVTLHIYAALEPTETSPCSTQSDIQRKINEILTSRIDTTLTKYKKDKDILQLSTLLNLVKKYFENSQLIKHKFEDSVLGILETTLTSVTKEAVNITLEIVEKHHLFEEGSKRFRLLAMAAMTHSEGDRDLFIELSRTKQMQNDFTQITEERLRELCHKYMSAINMYSRTRMEELVEVVKRIRALFTILQGSKRERNETILVDIQHTQLAKFSLVELLSHVESVENMCGGLHFIENGLVKRLKDSLQEASALPEELIRSLPTTEGRLLLQTRFSAEVILVLLNTFGTLAADNNVHENFLQVVRNCQFWIMIIQGKGSFRNVIERNENYIKAQECIRHISKHFIEHKIPVNLIQTIERNAQSTDNAKKLLQLHCTSDEIENHWTEISLKFEMINDQIKNVCNTIKHVQENVDGMSKIFSEMLDSVSDVKDRLSRGEFFANDCDDSRMIWRDLERLPGICNILKYVVQSTVFWNVCKDQVLEKFKDIRRNKTNDSLTDSLHLLFDEEPDPEEGNDMNCPEDCILFLDVLQQTGCKLYQTSWKEFTENDTITIERILVMFRSNSNIPNEIQIAREALHISADECTEETLQRLFKIEKSKRVVDAIECVLTTFKIDIEKDEIFSSAVTSFRQILKGTAKDFTFNDVKTSLSIINSLINELSEETINVFFSLKNASTLINFLQSIVDEDIRHLIDAAEDFSEQDVGESTVSALIEVKQELYPLLQSSDEKNCSKFLQMFEKQTKSSRSKRPLSEKINDCMNHLHNLMSLYKGVANRSEQTKEMIRSIMEKGKFMFYLETSDSSVNFEVKYKQKNQANVTRKRQKLADLRSRAHLLMNTDVHYTGLRRLNREEFVKFIENIDLCLDIADILKELFESGHTDFMTIKRKVKPKELLNYKRGLKEALELWQSDLCEERSVHFLLNFISGTQILIIYRFLQQNSNDIEAVRNILAFIHPDIDIASLVSIYNLEKQKIDEKWSQKTMLHCIGLTLESAMKGLAPFKRVIRTMSTKSLYSVAQINRIGLVHLEKDSTHTMKTILALYLNTTQQLPEPNQILFCNHNTSVTELELLLKRCRGLDKFCRTNTLYCITNIELLPNETQCHLTDILRHFQKEVAGDFLLSLICRGSRNHPFIDAWSECIISVTPASDRSVRDIYDEHFHGVITVTSEYAGLGKTSYIRKMAHKKGKGVVTIHISGKILKSELVQRVCALQVKNYHVLHIDVGNVENLADFDTFLFELLVLRHVTAERVSVGLFTSDIAIEIANTFNNTLRNSLKTAVLFQRKHLEWHGLQDFEFSKEINSPIQIVCRYLKELKSGNLDKKDLILDSLSMTSLPLPAKQCRALLSAYPIGNVVGSFPTFVTFINVLADQLKRMSQSPFFRLRHLVGMVGFGNTVRSTLVQAMIEASAEFATRSLKICKTEQTPVMEPNTNSHHKSQVMISDFNLLGSTANKTFESMIRWEDSNHLMFVFHNQNLHTVSAIYRHLSEVPMDLRRLFEGQMKTEMQDFSHLSQTELCNILHKIACVNTEPTPTNQLAGTDYALTADNLLKMVLILLRVKATVPVVIMGETGCGKTSLIRYLANTCNVAFDVMDIHAGVEEGEILKKVMENNDKALKNLNGENWLFLDEINTSLNIGLISDILCHHKCLGKDLAPNLVILGACNPYKKRTTKAICAAGIEGKVQKDELSNLVYRVLPLPETMMDYVWDFGSLHEIDEEKYIYRMLGNDLLSSPKLRNLYTSLLSASQEFVRTKESSYSVSLRDIERCRILTKWFINILPKKENTHMTECDLNIKAIILSLAHCYFCRFIEKDIRKQYISMIGNMFLMHDFEFGDNQDTFLLRVIREEQSDILKRMKLPPGTACNSALQENVFVIFVCILTRIPIFVVGKPGCSKSLAMQLIKSSVRGKDSEDHFFKQLPQLYLVSFQGSESSTSDGILKVFEKAEHYQQCNNKEDVLSVVILDEIGLAEVSVFNPLKVLHGLLEPNGSRQPNVAVVGISNWALDASKMNRAIHLSRTEMDEIELFETAVSISESFIEKENNDISLLRTEVLLSEKPKTEDFENELHGIASSYYQYISKLRFKNFHGLRDYYALVKFVARRFANLTSSCSESKKAEILNAGIARNFGGLPDEDNVRNDVFKLHIPYLNVHNLPVISLMSENIKDPIARHLLVITSGETGLSVIEHSLKTIECARKEIIFGSKFEEDLTDDYDYRILSRIILCMEEGLILILTNLERIYGSLYDMLNQNYTIHGRRKSCRVALGPYSNPVCHVAESFRCIVLMNENSLKEADPPFLNRFEKQHLQFTNILDSTQTRLKTDLENWIDTIACAGTKSLKKSDIFPVYNKDLVSTLILKVCSVDLTMDVFSACKLDLLKMMKPEAVLRQKTYKDKEKGERADDIIRQYFELPVHEGLEHCILSQLKDATSDEKQNGLLTIVFTNSNYHTSIPQVLTSVHFHVEKMSTFKSEKQLSASIGEFWQERDSTILILQCNSFEDRRHILLTKLIVERCREEYNAGRFLQAKHVYILIHLDKSKPDNVSEFCFMSKWKLLMLDSLHRPRIPLPVLYRMTLSDVVQTKRPLREHIKQELFWAFSRIRYDKHGRNVSSIENAVEKIAKSTELLDILEEEICISIRKESSEAHDRFWHLHIACDLAAIMSSTTFFSALESFVVNKINASLAKLIYAIELTGILQSYCSSTDSETQSDLSRKRLWMSGIHNKALFSIGNIPDENGPECYTCNTVDYGLSVPFGKFIYDCVENTRDDFMEIVAIYRMQCLLRDDEELPQDIFDEVLDQQGQFILQKLPDLQIIAYDSFQEDYLNDFCNITSYLIIENMECHNRIFLMKLILERRGVVAEKDPFIFILQIHSSLWVHFESIRAEILLIEKCTSMIPECLYEILEILSQFKSRCNILGAVGKKYKKTGNSDDDWNAKQIKSVPISFTRNNGKSLLRSDSHSSEFFAVEGSTNELIENVSADELDPDFNPTNDDDDVTIPSVADWLTVDDERPQCISKQFRDEFSEKDGFMKEKLVDTVCKNMLPTADCIKRYGGLSQWQGNINASLSLAAHVSDTSNMLYSLRICSDISNMLIVPLKMQHSYLETIGDILKSGKGLDSKECFDAIYGVIKEVDVASSEDISHTCQRILSSYFFRCLAIDTNTVALKYLFTLIKESCIPRETLGLYKIPLSTFLQICDVTLLKELLNVDLFTETDVKETDGNFRQGISSTDVLLKDMDYLVKHLFDNENWFTDPFLILLIDLLQDIYSEELDMNQAEDETGNANASFSALNDQAAVFYRCHLTIKERSPGLRYLASIAYCKSFVRSAARLIASTSADSCISIISVLDIVFSDLMNDENDDTLHGLLAFLMKEGTSFKSLNEFCRLFKQYNKSPAFIGRINTLKMHLDINNFLLCVHLDQGNHTKGCFSVSHLTGVSDITDLVSTAKRSVSGLVLLFSFGIREYYLYQTGNDIDDTRRTLAGIILNELMTNNFSNYTLNFVQCILGEKNFHVEQFVLSNTKPYTQVCEVSFLVQTYGLLMAHFEFHQTGTMPLLLECLVSPGKIVHRVLPGFQFNTKLCNTAQSSCKTRMGTCRCRYRLAFAECITHYECIMCKDTVETFEYDESVSPGMYNFDQKISHIVSTRDISPLTCHVLQFFVKGCILGSVTLGITSHKEVSHILQVLSVENLEVDFHWQAMKQLLNLEDQHLTIVLHALLIRMDSLLSTDVCSFKTADEMIVWEKEFDRIVCTVANLRIDTVRKIYMQHEKFHGCNEVEKTLYEINNLDQIPDEDKRRLVPAFYRKRATPNKNNFMLELLQQRKKYPVLDLVLQNENQLLLPHHILNIIQWHVATVANASYMLTRQDCMKMSVQNFIYFKQDTVKKNLMKRRFESFRESWEYLREYLDENELTSSMCHLHSASPMSECLMLGSDSILYKVLQSLVRIQNVFLDRMLHLADKCETLHGLKRTKGISLVRCTNITEIKKQELIDFSLDWDSLVAQESQCDLIYGYGRLIQYDFYSIEETIAKKILYDKSYIIFEGPLPQIIFIDELHRNYSSLIKELKSCIPQEHLPSDISDNIRARKEEDPQNAEDLFTHLGIVMSLLKKTKGDPDQPLVDFIDRWKSILREFPKHHLPSPERHIKLCHVVSLRELLEELCADSVKEGLADEYRGKPDGPIQDYIQHIMEDEDQAQMVVNAIKRFSYRCLSSKIADPLQCLRIYLSEESFWPLDSLKCSMLRIKDKNIPLEKVLPDWLMVQHTYHCLTALESEIGIHNRSMGRQITFFIPANCAAIKRQGGGLTNYTCLYMTCVKPNLVVYIFFIHLTVLLEINAEYIYIQMCTYVQLLILYIL